LTLITEESSLHEFFEEERHRCEVRQVLRWRAEDRSKAIDYLSKVRQKRSDKAADKLQKDCTEQWAKGNRGIQGDWR
jgi:hypothetical protein